MLADPSNWHAARVNHLQGEIRNLYWHIRNSQRGRQDAYRRRYYRRIEVLKDELLTLGQSKRDVLDLLACCRRRICRVGCPSCGNHVDWQRWI
ncbi:hypothetical protein [Cupriavidus metallidurans]|uniref:hypothetical protein n=1 Tax=Cupriavidus metallidurans TaxID=119219 RepID=UPI000B0E6FDD|nr:hypothetical protein [Cupriavidus metallidurans]